MRLTEVNFVLQSRGIFAGLSQKVCEATAIRYFCSVKKGQ